MRTFRCFGLMAASLWLATPATAQSTSSGDVPHGHFFLYFAPGRSAPSSSWGSADRAGLNAFYVGGGGEAVMRRRFGVGTDLGRITDVAAHQNVSTLSVNGFVHLRQQHSTRIDPYFTGGYSGYFYQPNHRSAANAGAGVNYWFASRRGYNLGSGIELRRGVGGPATELRVSIRLWQ